MTLLGAPADKEHARNIALLNEAKGGPRSVITQDSSAIVLQLTLQ